MKSVPVWLVFLLAMVPTDLAAQDPPSLLAPEAGEFGVSFRDPTGEPVLLPPLPMGLRGPGTPVREPEARPLSPPPDGQPGDSEVRAGEARRELNEVVGVRFETQANRQHDRDGPSGVILGAGILVVTLGVMTWMLFTRSRRGP